MNSTPKARYRSFLADSHSWSLPIFVLICLSCLAGSAATIDGRGYFDFPNEPKWINSGEGWKGTVVPKGFSEIWSLTIDYAYPGETAKRIHAYADRSNPDLDRYHFNIPAHPAPSPGTLTYVATAHYGEPGNNEVRSEERSVALALVQELDITGDAAVALLYPLGGPEYTVRYVPCCNIFGGVTIATRVPVNPEATGAGLPEKRLSDFIILKPDGLSASTMGMYFDFRLGADRVKGLTPALYEFDGNAWVEFKSVEVDPVTGRISMHCPDGGTFVVAAKR